MRFFLNTKLFIILIDIKNIYLFLFRFSLLKFLIYEYFYHRYSRFLGSHLAERCLSKNHKVSGCDTLVGGDISNIKGLDINFTNTACENLEEMTKILKNIDVVCHAAAYAHEVYLASRH